MQSDSCCLSSGDQQRLRPNRLACGLVMQAEQRGHRRRDGDGPDGDQTGLLAETKSPNTLVLARWQ